MDCDGERACLEPRQPGLQEEHDASAQPQTMNSGETTISTPTTACHVDRLPIELLPIIFDHMIEQAVHECTGGAKTPYCWHIISISPAHDLFHPGRSRVWKDGDINSLLKERVATFRGVCRSWRQIAQAYCDSVVSLDARQIITKPAAVRARLLSKPSPAHLELINQADTVWEDVKPLLKSLLEERLGARLVGLSLRVAFRNQHTLRQLVDALPRGAAQLKSLDFVSWISNANASVDVAIEDELYATIASMRGLRQLRALGMAVNVHKLLAAVAFMRELEQLSVTADTADPFTGSPRLATTKLRALELGGANVVLHEALLFTRPHAPSLVSLRIQGQQLQPPPPAPAASLQPHYSRLERLIVYCSEASPHVPIAMPQPLLQEVLEQSPRLTHLDLYARDVSLTGLSDPATSEASSPSTPTLLQQIVQKAGSGVMKALRLRSFSAIDRAALRALKKDPEPAWVQSGVHVDIIHS